MPPRSSASCPASVAHRRPPVARRPWVFAVVAVTAISTVAAGVHTARGEDGAGVVITSMSAGGTGQAGATGPDGLQAARVYASPAADCAAARQPDRQGAVVTPESFGAVGDGVADDTDAVQEALDAVTAGGTVVLGKGKTYRHTDVLVAEVAGSRITGPGTLLATEEERSAFWVSADDIVVDGGLTFRMGATTKRWDAYEQMKVRLAGVDGVVLEDITVAGAAAAGVYIGGSSDFRLVDVHVSDTRADGIHMTGGSHDGVVCRPTVVHSGDDGVAVVSYKNDDRMTRRITVQSPTVSTTSWGRGLSVVGGKDVTYLDVDVDSSSAAAIYVANEGAPYYTYSARRISFLGGTITNANTTPEVDHGAVLLHSAQTGHVLTDVIVDGMTISGTRTDAWSQVGIVHYGGTVSRATLSDITITGGGHDFNATVPATSYNTLDWVVDGVPQRDHWGWAPAALLAQPPAIEP